MTTPKGKILLAKLPKDIVQFCIEPMLMITKGEVEKNYQNLLCHFKGMTLTNITEGSQKLETRYPVTSGYHYGNTSMDAEIGGTGSSTRRVVGVNGGKRSRQGSVNQQK